MLKTKLRYFSLVLILVLGVGLGSYWFGEKSGEKAGYNRAKQKIARYESKIKEMFPQPKEIFSLDGNITGIEGKVLTLRVPAANFNPFAEDLIKKVKITDSTEIVKRMAKPDKEFEKEQADYDKLIKSFKGKPEEMPQSPLPFKDLKIGLSDLKIGDGITVESKENIKGKKEFEAKKIILQFSP